MPVFKGLRKRGNGSTYMALVVLVAVVTALCYHTDDVEFWKSNIRQEIKGNQLTYVVAFITVGLADFLIGEIFRRICIFAEELGQCSRYDGNPWKLMKAAFLSHGAKQFVVVPIFMSLLSFLSLNGGNCCLIWNILNTTWNYAVILAITIIPYLLGLKEPTKAEMSEYLETHKLNVGHGLAWSYYFGYIRLILPSLNKRLQKWQDDEGVGKSKMSHKLYILVPKSCYCYPTLKDADQNVSNCSSAPEPIHACRGGTVARVYRNTVYQFPGSDEKEVYYCCAEYATPILSLYEMSENAEAGLSHDDRLEQMRRFCTTFNEILSKNPEFRENCELIMFDDVDEDGKEVEISTILREKIDRDLDSGVANGNI